MAARPFVIVAGSLHYDIMVDAPDRPRKGETVTGRRWAPKCGGKGGNQAVAAARRGVRTAMIGAVGDDDFGRALLAGLDRAGVERGAVEVRAGLGSGMSVAIVDDGGDYGAVIVSGANLALSPDQLGDRLLGAAQVLVLQNEIPEEVNAALARRARRRGVRTILNAAPARPFTTDLAADVDILIVNALEAEALGGGVVDSLDRALAAAWALTGICEAVVVTAGGEGVAAADTEGLALAIPGLPITVASTHGAGDAFVGTFAASLAGGATVDASLEIANREAARIVATPEHLR